MSIHVANPKSWQVLRLGILSLVIAPTFGLLNALYRIILDPVSFQPSTLFYPGIVGALLSLGLAVAALLQFSKQSQSGFHSWLQWAGVIPAALVLFFWAFMILGEFLFSH